MRVTPEIYVIPFLSGPDFAYDVWPEMCWYGYDHVAADLPTSGGAPPVVKREWRAD